MLLFVCFPRTRTTLALRNCKLSGTAKKRASSIFTLWGVSVFFFVFLFAMFVPLTASFLSLLPDRVLYKRTRYDLKKKEKKAPACTRGVPMVARGVVLIWPRGRWRSDNGSIRATSRIINHREYRCSDQALLAVGGTASPASVATFSPCLPVNLHTHAHTHAGARAHWLLRLSPNPLSSKGAARVRLKKPANPRTNERFSRLFCFAG